MEDAALSLAEGFAPATHGDWAALVSRTLKGAPPERLTHRRPGGTVVDPLYVAGDGPAPLPLAVVRDSVRPWDVRTIVRQPDPARANADILHDLAGGAASVLIRIDPTGEDGVAIGEAEALARTLDGVVVEIAGVALDAGFLGPHAADWLSALARASPAAALAFHLDPVSAFAKSGSSPGPMEAHVIAAATTAVRLAEPYPRAGLFLASGRTAHEAGGGEAAELALMAASAVAYAKALVRAGLSMDGALSRIVLGIAVDGDPIVSIAKLRAARRLWSSITSACGGEIPARIEARSSRRMLTAADAWTNLARLTAAGFAAAVGGADAVALGAFTDALGPPTDFARRQARNVQLVLMEEAGLGRVADPAAGSWCAESLTDQIAAAAWSLFRAIEADGGVLTALASGRIAEAVAADREALRTAAAAGDLKILGVTHFRPDVPVSVEVETPSPRPAVAAPDPRVPGPDARCPPLSPIRLEELAA